MTSGILSVGGRLRTLMIASVSAGFLIGVVLHKLLPVQIPTSLSLGPAFTGCRPDAETNSCNCGGDLAPLGTQRDPAARASELLTHYAASLCQLASAIDDFRRAPVDDQAQLRRAARALFVPIRAVNDSARELQWSRLPLTLDVLSRPGGDSSDAEALACGLKSANKYQVETFRNNLNALMVNIVAAWQGNGDATTFENIRRQQATEWPKLALKLRRGCEQYRSGWAKFR